jgi:enoyl-CoA hydratase
MDLILTGRGVSGDEAVRMGLVNRLTPRNGALAGAVELAKQIAAFPQRCMRGDRRSAIEQWGMSEDDAGANEFAIGIATIRSGETQLGASRFSAGAGRHGSFGG